MLISTKDHDAAKTHDQAQSLRNVTAIKKHEIVMNNIGENNLDVPVS